MIEFLIIGLICGYISGRLLIIFIQMKLDDREDKKWELVYHPVFMTHFWQKQVTQTTKGDP